MICFCLKGSPPYQRSQNGFAIFTVLMLSAIMGLISLAMVNNYLTNTRAATLDLQRLKAKHALDAGLNFAALSLSSPRAVVSAAAIPSQVLRYQALDFDVEIYIENEAGFIAWSGADQGIDHDRLLERALLSSDADQASLDEIKKLRSERNAVHGHDVSLRDLKHKLSGLTVDSRELLSFISVHSKHQGVNPNLASEKVLALIPGLSVAQRKELIRQRTRRAPSLIERQIGSQYFTTRVSAFYRIRLATQVGDQRFERTQLIKMINQPGRLFDVVGMF